MHRRDFLRTTGSVAAVAGVSATAFAKPSQAPIGRVEAPSVVSGARELGLSVRAPDNGRGFGENARRLARRIEELTGGRYRIAILPQERTQEAGVQVGSAHDSIGLDRAFAYFAGLPGRAGVEANDLDAWLTLGGGQQLWDDLAKSHGFKPFLSGHSGANPAIWFRNPRAAEAGFTGLKYAAEGLAIEVARGLGAQPTSWSFDGAASAFENGKADAVEGPGAMLAMASGFAERAKFALAGGINRNGTAQSCCIALGQWQRMTATDQAAIASACAAEFRLSHAEARVHERLASRVMQSRHGVEFATPPAALRDAIGTVSDAVVAHVAGSSRDALRINASFMAFKAMLPEPGGDHTIASA